MKRLFAIILAVCLLSGCSLAQEGQRGGDRLTGFFITVSRKEGDTIVDYWDEEATGMEFISNHDQAGKKLYAEFIGTPDEVFYRFPEGCGLYGFTFDALDENGEPLYRSSDASDEVDMHVAYHVGSETACRITATIYGEKGCDAIVAVNPVYQTADGAVYVLSDQPISIDVGTMGGYKWFRTVERTDGNGCALELSIENVVLPERYIILEMSVDNTVLKSTEYAPDAMPEGYIPGPDTAYIMLEAAGEQTVRTVYSPADESAVMDTYYPGSYGLCIKGYTRIEWEGEA